jgi:predicted O-methyltransferase YrrM
MSEFPNWFNITAKANFEALLPNSLRKNPDALALQIGAYTGDATEWILSNTQWELNDVDTWEGSQEVGHQAINFEDVEKHYDLRHGENASLHKFKMTSDTFFNVFTHEPDTYDFIYIDGDHTASQTVKDGLNALPFLKPGGIIAFDDYTWTSGKGLYYDPRPGIDSFHHICQELVELLVINSQAWFKKL